jgi:hypothetical protein
MTSPSIAASAGHDRKAGSAVKEAEVKDIGIMRAGHLGHSVAAPEGTKPWALSKDVRVFRLTAAMVQWKLCSL